MFLCLSCAAPHKKNLVNYRRRQQQLPPSSSVLVRAPIRTAFIKDKIRELKWGRAANGMRAMARKTTQLSTGGRERCESRSPHPVLITAQGSSAYLFM